jgi:hypothetical protein
MTKEDIVIEIKIYLRNLTHVNDSFNIYKKLIELNSKPETLEFLNISPAFFQITSYSLEHTFIIGIAKIIDFHSDKNIFKLIRQCKYNHKLFKESYKIELFEHELELTSDIINSIKERRDKFYAHADKKYFYDTDKMQDSAPLTYNDFDKLVSVINEGLNGLLQDLNSEVFSKKSLNYNDIEKLVDRTLKG